jgi:hypothetical protein
MIKFKLIDKKHKLNFESTGYYSVFLTGGFSIELGNDLEIELKGIKSNDWVEIIELDFKKNTIIEFTKATECFKFNISRIGEYEIEFKNIENLVVKKSSLFLSNLLFPTQIPLEKIEVIIK